MEQKDIDRIIEIDGRTGQYIPNVHVIGGNNPLDTMPTSDFGTQPNNVFSNAPTIDLSQWHTSAMLWTPDSIVFYLDGNSIDVTTRDTNKYLIPMQMIIENGLPALNYCGDSINNFTQLPITYELDYVKVWQPAMACDTNKIYVTATQTNFVSKHYESLILGGTGGSFTFNSGNGLGRGVNYVLFDQGTEISGTATFQADVLPCWQKMPSYKSLLHPPEQMPTNFLKTLNYVRQK